MLLGAPGLTTRSKKLRTEQRASLRTERSDATNAEFPSWHRVGLFQVPAYGAQVAACAMSRSWVEVRFGYRAIVTQDAPVTPRQTQCQTRN